MKRSGHLHAHTTSSVSFAPLRPLLAPILGTIFSEFSLRRSSADPGKLLRLRRRSGLRSAPVSALVLRLTSFGSAVYAQHAVALLLASLTFHVAALARSCSAVRSWPRDGVVFFAA